MSRPIGQWDNRGVKGRTYW